MPTRHALVLALTMILVCHGASGQVCKLHAPNIPCKKTCKVPRAPKPCPTKPCPPRPAPPVVQQQAMPAVSPGMFVAPPMLGTSVGETRGWRINGLRVTFPEVTLAMPTLHLPGLSRTRRGAEMYLDEGRAAYAMNPAYQAALYAQTQGAMYSPAGQIDPRIAAAQYAAFQQSLAQRAAAARELAKQQGQLGQLEPAGLANEQRNKPEDPVQQQLDRLSACERRLERQMEMMDHYLNRLQQLPPAENRPVPESQNRLPPSRGRESQDALRYPGTQTGHWMPVPSRMAPSRAIPLRRVEQSELRLLPPIVPPSNPLRAPR